MTSKQLVHKAIHFQSPERLPFDMPVSGPTDALRAKAFPVPGGKRKLDADGTHADHFGCRFAVLNNMTIGQPTRFPIQDLRNLDEYKFPDPMDEKRFQNIEQSVREAGDKYMYADIIWYTFFERMNFLHGAEATLRDLHLDRKRMLDLADRIVDYNIAVVKEVGRRFQGKVDAIAMADDWGTQTTTLIGLDLFRDFFLPRYRKLFAAVRDQGMDVWFHSCGYIMDFIPNLIDAGVQILNLQQPRIFNIRELGARFAGAVCFNVPVDIQATMPRGSRDQIRREAKELIDCLSTPKGGIVASEHPDYRGNGIDPIKGQWAYDAFRECDPFSK